MDSVQQWLASNQQSELQFLDQAASHPLCCVFSLEIVCYLNHCINMLSLPLCLVEDFCTLGMDHYLYSCVHQFHYLQNFMDIKKHNMA